MKKVLFIANSDRHILLCHLPYLKLFSNNNYEVHVATNTSTSIPYCDKKIKLSLKRHPFSLSNIKAFLEIRKIVREEEYDLISCHTPMGGFLGRSSIIHQQVKTKVFYTAHGFHFYRGAPVFNWVLYYPIEKYLAKYTTCLFTMNEEDYKLAKEKFSCDVYKINGIGFSKEKLKETKSIKKLKQELGIKKDEFVVSYIAEISKRKGQLKLVKECNKIDLEKEKIKIVLIGDSIIKNFDRKLKNKNILYIPFQKYIGSYLNISDLILSTSIQEGLPLHIMEAMYKNKRIIATDIRGNRDLIINNKNGILVPKNRLDLLVSEMLKIKNKKKNFVISNDMSQYEIENVLEEIKKIYNKYLESRLK